MIKDEKNNYLYDTIDECEKAIKENNINITNMYSSNTLILNYICTYARIINIVLLITYIVLIFLIGSDSNYFSFKYISIFIGVMCAEFCISKYCRVKIYEKYTNYKAGIVYLLSKECKEFQDIEDENTKILIYKKVFLNAAELKFE